eukprot:355265-Chlamydomonas_euryale.AAC.22
MRACHRGESQERTSTPRFERRTRSLLVSCAMCPRDFSYDTKSSFRRENDSPMATNSAKRTVLPSVVARRKPLAQARALVVF